MGIDFLTAQQNAKARRNNALSDIRWYAWRIVGKYRLNSGVPYTKESAIGFCDSSQAAEKDPRILALVELYRLLEASKTDGANADSLKQTIKLTRRAWIVCHEFDDLLRGDKLPKQ